MNANEPITVIIAEDEPVQRRRLARLLGAESDVHIVAQCSGGRDAIMRIREEAPDVVFLDVQMPDCSGFEVLREVGVDRMPVVVFVTAFEQYAVKAFEVHAVDYLLKPYDEARFKVALDRARAQVMGRAGGDVPDADRMRSLLAEMLKEMVPAVAAGSRVSSFEQIAVKVDGAVRILRVDDVDWLETEGNYVRIHVGKESYLLRQTAARMESDLDPRRFVRVHRRYLVNLSRVVEVQPWFGGDAVLVLRDGYKLRLSRTYREHFHSRLLSDRADRSEKEEVT
ncbi:MAG: LytTr DNA-binding region [Gemmatimonadetes bacterium]|nr:LytTr DNA-binding region [Gemmatimonadota bacterium]